MARRSALLAALLLVGCAAPAKQAPEFQTRLGHSPPPPGSSATPAPNAAPATSSRASPGSGAGSGTPGPIISLEAVMAGAVHTPDPDPLRLAQTNAARFHKRDGELKIGFCVGANGHTDDVEVLARFPDDPMVDALFVEAIERWRFEPVVISGQPTKVCTSRIYRLEFEGDPTPTAPTRGAAPPTPVTAADQALCRHVTTIVMTGAGADQPTLPADQLEEIVAICAASLADDRQHLGEAEVERRSKCVLAAASVEAISACKAR